MHIPGNIEPALFQCRVNVGDVAPALKQRWVTTAHRLLGSRASDALLTQCPIW